MLCIKWSILFAQIAHTCAVVHIHIHMETGLNVDGVHGHQRTVVEQGEGKYTFRLRPSVVKFTWVKDIPGLIYFNNGHETDFSTSVVFILYILRLWSQLNTPVVD